MNQGGKRGGRQAELQSVYSDIHVGRGIGNGHHDGRARGRPDFHRAGRHLVQATKQGVALRRVKALHTANVAKIVALAQEFRYRVLHERRGSRRQARGDIAESTHRFKRDDEKA